MCATSIGLTFSHSPVPGERKSGIPDGTEIPAPVSATTDSASRTREASRSTRSRSTADETLTAIRLELLALPVRRALGEEGADALLGVLALEDAGERGLLGLDPGVEVAGGGDVLDLGQRQRRRLAELARPRQGGVEQLVVGDRAVDQPELVGLVGADGVAGQVHLQGLVLAHQAGEALGAAEAGDDAELDLGLAEDGRL